tara:strand:+ start:1839 stop:3218 length:1380 start_codon:yes stop_codon:yes gene_type:complete
VIKKNPGSFRDPSGHLFQDNGVLFRQVNVSYQKNYELLINTGLYSSLSKQKKLIEHKEINSDNHDYYKLLKPSLIENISYPYEWSFTQLKDAALLTLDIQKQALMKGISLKDASAFNVTFNKGRPIFIDTLSFESYSEGAPWVAYKQFCQHFLAPLSLMSLTDIRLSGLLKNYVDGIPLDLTSSLLPKTSYFKFGMLIHVHIHAKSQKKYDSIVGNEKITNVRVSKNRLLALIDSLEVTIKKLNWSAGGTEWDSYYSDNNNYNKESMSEKETIVESFISEIHPNIVWDLGANDGHFSRIALKHAQNVISWDIDPSCVERNYLAVKNTNQDGITPLLIDLTNPSPSIGWNCEERDSFVQRAEVDLTLALGLVHHLAISNNLPLRYIFKFFFKITNYLIIEFIPKSDSQVEKLLLSRRDIFDDYTKDGFEKSFHGLFNILSFKKLHHSERTLYFLEKKLES